MTDTYDELIRVTQINALGQRVKKDNGTTTYCGEEQCKPRQVPLKAAQAFLTMLRAPLVLEATRTFVHRVLHWSGFGSATVDTASMVASACIVFFAGWLAMRQTRRIGQSILAGILVWAFSFALVTLLLAMEVLLLTRLPPDEARAALAGYVLASMLFLQVMVAIAALGAFVARKITSRTP